MRRLFKCGHAVLFDGMKHRVACDAEILTDDERIAWIGRGYQGEADEVIDAADGLAVPGFINLHVHVGAHLGDRMVLDAGRHDLFRSGFLHYCPTKGIDGPTIFSFENPRQTIAYSLASLARFGSTTIVEMGGDFSGDMSFLLECAEAVGLRLYTSPGFSAKAHYFDSKGRLQLHVSQQGLRGLESTLQWIQNQPIRPLFRPILVPYEFMLSDDELLLETKRAARSLSIGIAIHVAESVVEFNHSLRDSGRTPVQQLDHLEFLGPEVVLGHAVYLSGHSQVAHRGNDDVALLASSGTHVAHCPSVFARRGVQLESLAHYQSAGVNLGLGTDSYPQDIIEEMRFAAITGKLADRSFHVATSRDVFNAATLGGARALGRPDLGRIAIGAQSDLVIMDFARLRIGPHIDPIKALVHCANGELVRQVVVAGKDIVRDGEVLGLDSAEALAGVRRSSIGALRHFDAFNPFPGAFEDVYPPSFEAIDPQTLSG